MSLRLYGLEIFRSDFRFHITDKGSESFFVFYNDKRLTVNCSCPSGGRCSHTAYLHETMNNESDDVLLSYLRDSREGNSQDVTKATVERMRGAFAREYNLAKGVVQYPADSSPRGPRAPLGWEGNVPGANIPMRVITRTAATFMVYGLGSDAWELVVGIANPICQSEKCRRGCKHEEAVREAVRIWRANGLMPRAQLTMVEKVEPIKRTGSVEGGWLSIPPGFNGTYTIGMTGLEALAKTAREQEDMNKAKKLLEKKEEPKPEKPAKPRTRFTDLEL